MALPVNIDDLVSRTNYHGCYADGNDNLQFAGARAFD